MIRFGVFELDTVRNELRKAGRSVRLRPQACRALAALAGRPGEIVTREELRDQIWSDGTFVDFEHGLNLCIREIREALGDSAESPRFIQTIPRRGYSFIASVNAPAVPNHGALPPRRAGRWSVAAAILVLLGVGAYVASGRLPLSRDRLMIAVLPFHNLSGDPSQEYFSDGLTEELISELSRLSPEHLGVIARTSSMAYKSIPRDVRRIGRELGVEYVLEGSVRREGDRVRVATQLIRCDDGTHVWADTYDDRLSSVLSLQVRLATAVAAQVRLTLQPAAAARTVRSLVDPEAYESVLRGRFYWNRRNDDDLKRAVQQFERALDRDPSYAPAYSGLAVAVAMLGQYGVLGPADALERSKTAARTALKLDPNLADAHAALGLVSLLYEYDWASAQQEFERAIRLNPEHASARQWYAEYLIAHGRTADALAQLAKAREADPNSLIIGTASGRPYYYARQYDRAILEFQRTLARDPSFFPARGMLGRAYQQKGLLAQGLAELKRAEALTPGNPVILSDLAYGLARTGEHREARRVLGELKARAARAQFVPSYGLAVVHCGLGEIDAALQFLQKAYDERSTDIVHLAVDPRLDALHSDNRFRTLVHRIGLPLPTWE